jgi:hypothetical protein
MSNLLIALVKETVVTDAIARYLVNILHLIGVLVRSAPLIKEFLVLRVVVLVVL